MARRWIGSHVGQTVFAAGVLLGCAQSGDISPSGNGVKSTSGGTSSGVGGTTTVASGGSVETGDGGMTSEGGMTGKGGVSTIASKTGGAGGASSSGVAGRTAAGGTKAAGGSGSAVAGASFATAGTAGRSGNGGTVSAAGSTGKGGTASGAVAGATGAGEFPCTAANSEAVKTDTDFDAALDQCYSWTKTATGTFQIGNWSGKTLTVQLKDSKKLFADVEVASGWTAFSGVASGEVYFYVSKMSSGPSARIKVNSF